MGVLGFMAVALPAYTPAFAMQNAPAYPMQTMPLPASTGPQARDPWDIPVGFIPMGRQTQAPRGFLDFCKRYPEDCMNPPAVYTPVLLTTRRMRELNTVNGDVNATVFFNSDYTDRWDYPEDNIGDCEDIVIEKRRRLMDMGWPEETLLITIVRLKEGDFAGRRTHAVLTARTAKGDYILDNEINHAVPWTTAGKLFDYVMMQSEKNPRVWALVDSSNRLQ